MTSRFMLIFAAVSGFVYVALGAFGAHVLSKSMGVVEMGWIQTGLNYQAFHTLAVLGLAVAMQRRISIWFYWSSVFLALGTVLFSGSLYCLALSHLRLPFPILQSMYSKPTRWRIQRPRSEQFLHTV